VDNSPLSSTKLGQSVAPPSGVLWVVVRGTWTYYI